MEQVYKVFTNFSKQLDKKATMAHKKTHHQRKSISLGPFGVFIVFLAGLLIGRFYATLVTTDDTNFGLNGAFSDAPSCFYGSSTSKNGWHSIDVFNGDQAHLREMLPPTIDWFSQASQDRVVAALLGNKRNGFFVDLAANDATVLSNTFSLEQRLQWSGICIEPTPQYWANLTYRDCQVVAAIVGDKRMDEVHFRFDAGDHSGIAGEGFDNGVKFKSRSQKKYTVTLHEILFRFKAPKHIDYLSLDVEGAEELIMLHFPFSEYHISILTVERPKERLRNLLETNGFQFLKRLTRWGETLWAHQSVMDQLDLQVLDQFGPPRRNATTK